MSIVRMNQNLTFYIIKLPIYVSKNQTLLDANDTVKTNGGFFAITKN
jgi:hypothetical protein